MSGTQKTTRALTKCVRVDSALRNSSRLHIRSFTTTCLHANVVQEPSSPSLHFDPTTVTSPKGEKLLARRGTMPIGSRRRRAALKSSDNIPFEQLPYQCFQEARKILQADRTEKLQEIAAVRARIAQLEDKDVATVPGGEERKRARLEDMRQHLEDLKILADINDPLIKKRFEDGEGDMNKPIYRYLSDKKWRSFQRLIISQRISQFHLVPDVLPYLDPTADVRLAFGRRKVQPGDFLESEISESAPYLKVQVFNKGERLVTVAVVDSDVPDVENDSFSSRCHYLACNIAISPTRTTLQLSNVSEESQLVFPWLAPFAQKGSPYHRYSLIVLEQVPGQLLNTEVLRRSIGRDGFDLRKLTADHTLKPLGVSLFRSQWDEGTQAVMQRAGVEGSAIEFKRKRIEPLKPKQKARGWEAKHSSAKYKALRR